MKTFYIETFGCQMNAHDSEKVIGTLVSEGYRQVEKPEDADLVLYNTCSIRDKAEQKVFHRLNEYKKLRRFLPGRDVVLKVFRNGHRDRRIAVGCCRRMSICSRIEDS